ncbi:MAG: hypothetical protein EPO67_24445 [Reyranella sp.]|nr:MAG: hypothetical protein EPO67_24445 [Reyranella sp.]
MRIDCGEVADERIRAAYGHLMKDGYVVLDRVIAPAALGPLQAALEGMPPGTSVASRRHVLPLDLAGAAAEPSIYANPAIVALAREALDTNAVLLGLSADTALPGAGPQHVDRDGRPLFDAAVSALLPAHAVVAVLPLDGASEVAVWPGSHRWKTRDENAAPELAELAPGACLVRDARLLSSDAGNRSGARRTVLRAVYARRWFRDALQGLQRPTSRPALREGFLAGVAPKDLGLFAHLKAP